jgi:hypothetical protein
MRKGFVSAKCGLYGTEMPIKVRRNATSSDGIKWFAPQFDHHMELKHLSESRIHGQREA